MANSPGHIAIAEPSIRPASLVSASDDQQKARAQGNDKSATVDIDVGVEEGRHQHDVKHKQVFSGWTLAWLAYQSTGVIYGDIGTSPLYVYSSTFTAAPSHADLLGALSLIIWSITLMVTVKYIFIVLRADDEGEGGTFALYSLLSRYAHIAKRDPREETMVKMERYRTNDLGRMNKSARNLIERNGFIKVMLKFVGVLGVSLVLSDGILTPSQSILGAIQGLDVVNPNISQSVIVGVTCVIIVLLFAIQPLGTAKVGSTFAPVIIVWFLFNLSFGIYNLAKHDYTVLKAFSPYFAGHFLVMNKTAGWEKLGGILLCFTGTEALFSDLGAFTRQAIQISWLGLAYPSLLLAYIGQAAYISDVPSAYSNPFFNTVPPGMLYPGLVVSILAAIVASQAMITAAFQLLSQIMKLSYFPQIKMVHTSKTFHGHLYIPLANWLMMIGTVIVTAAFKTTTKLGLAYGVCVVMVTFITTCMVSLVAVVVWRLPIFLVAFGFLVFACLDCAFLSSALTKVPNGAWLTLALACVLACIFILWRYGKEQQWRAEASDRFPPSAMISMDEAMGTPTLQPTFGGGQLASIKGMAIFFDKVGTTGTTPTVFIHFVQKFHSVSDVIVFFHLRPLSVPSVPAEEQVEITRCFSRCGGAGRVPIPNCYRFVVRHGYVDQVVTPNLGGMIYEHLYQFLCSEAARAPPLPSVEPDAVTMANAPLVSWSSPKNDLMVLDRAYEEQIVYIIGKEQMRIRTDCRIWRRFLLSIFLWIRENSRSKVQSLNVQVDRLVEVGFVKDV